MKIGDKVKINMTQVKINDNVDETDDLSLKNFEALQLWDLLHGCIHTITAVDGDGHYGVDGDDDVYGEFDFVDNELIFLEEI